jgi:hypothetical protein
MLMPFPLDQRVEGRRDGELPDWKGGGIHGNVVGGLLFPRRDGFSCCCDSAAALVSQVEEEEKEVKEEEVKEAQQQRQPCV